MWLVPENQKKNIYINEVKLDSLGNILITDHSLSPYVQKTSKEEIEGSHGSLNTSFSIFDYVRFENRIYTLTGLVIEETRGSGINVLSKIDNLLRGKELRIKLVKDTKSFLRGFCNKEQLQFNQKARGIYEFAVEIEVYPFLLKAYEGRQLWNEIRFSTDYFFRNTTNMIEANGYFDYVHTFAKPTPRELKIVSVGGPGSLLLDGEVYNFAEGINYIILNLPLTEGEQQTLRLSNPNDREIIVTLSYYKEEEIYV